MTAVVQLLLFLPTILTGDYYEIADPLVYFTLPSLVLGAALGALVGAAPRPVPAPAGAESRALGPARRAVVLVTAALLAVLAVWVVAWATGLVGAAPLGIG